MKRWGQINKEIKKVSDPEELKVCLLPFRNQIRDTLKELQTTEVKVAYNEIRAQILTEARISLALLDAAAYEEELLIIKN